MYLIIIAFVYIMFLIIDIRIYLNKRKTQNLLSVKNQSFNDLEFCEFPEGSLHFSIPYTSSMAKLQKPLVHYYCFGRGRHSGSFYLKLGAAGKIFDTEIFTSETRTFLGFCFGHLIHSGLLLGYQIIFLTSDSEKFYECASVATLVLDIIYPIYSFLLLYFIFKYSNVSRTTMIFQCETKFMCFRL